MTRRLLLQLLALGCALLAASRLSLGRRRGLRFYVAGARFGHLPENVHPGERVLIRREKGRETRFSLSTRDGGLLGYVPRDLIPAIERGWPVEARLTSFNSDAVPWKRYEVETVQLGFDVSLAAQA